MTKRHSVLSDGAMLGAIAVLLAYDHEPAPGRKKNDLKLVSALAWKF